MIDTVNKRKCSGIKKGDMIKKRDSFFRIVICLLIYFTILYIQIRIHPTQSISGVIAQLQVMISTYLVISVKKTGYIVAVMINVLISVLVTTEVIGRGNISALPGIFVPLCTIVTITIISLYGRKLNEKLKEVMEQKEEIGGLYEELVATEEEVRQQNTQLTTYNESLKEKEEKLNHLAYIDVLTELPNRKMIINRLDLLVNLTSESVATFAVVFIDLDNFKRVNDTKGHHIGDILLQSVVKRIQKLLFEEDMLGRLGGDEFALIIQHTRREQEIFEYVDRIRAALLESFQIENFEYNISASFGISIYPKDGDDSTELLKCADTAMYKSKDNGKNGIQFFSKKMNEEIMKRLEFENHLVSSLQNQELYLVFQPQYQAKSKKLTGFEALTRWKSPDLGLVNPTKFIPIAEEIGYIIPMGEWILKTACKMIRHLIDEYTMDITVSVNVSSVQITDPLFVQHVKDALTEAQIEGSHLELEITESVFISSIDSVIEILLKLKEMGIRIALDDFGTGYSSLSYLQKLPIDTLKIDKSFIDGINHTSDSKQIIGSIIALVHKMGMSVVAEGVENEMQLEYLKGQDCDTIQGFLWGKPLEEKEIVQLLSS